MEETSEGRDRKLLSAAGRAGGIMVFSLFLSRLLGLLRDTAIAGHFGLKSANDSYAIATQIPDLIFMLIAGGGLSSAFIPVFSEFWYQKKEKQAWKVFSVVVTMCALIAAAVITIFWLLTPWIVSKYGHDRMDAVPAAIVMSRIMLPAQFAFLVGSVLLATLYARKQFLGPSLAPNVYNIGIIVGAIVLPGIFGFGIVGVAWGALVGAFVGNLLLPMILMIPQGVHFKPSLDVKTEGVSKFFKLLLPVILGFSLPSMVTLVTQYFASPYGEGSNTAIRYANNLMQAPLGIFGQSLALGAFPALSQFFAERRMDLYRDLVSKTMRTVLYLCVAASVFMYALSPLMVQIIYGYGKAADDPQQLNLIAAALRIYCFAIPIWCIQPVLMRGFFSLHNTLKPVAIGTAMTGLFIGMCVLVKGTLLGVLALPWATNVAVALLVVVLVLALEKEVGTLDKLGLLTTCAKTLIAAIPAGVAMYFLAGVFEPHRKLLAVGWFLLLVCAGGTIFYLGTRLLKMPEGRYLDRALNKIKRKRADDGQELIDREGVL